MPADRKKRESGRRLELLYRFHWLRSELGAILGVTALVAAAGGGAWYIWASRSEPAQTEFATVVHFGHRDSKYGVYPLVVVRLKNGSERQLMVGTRNALVHCRKGSVIRLVHRGSAMFVDPRGCGRVRVDTPGAPLASARTESIGSA